MEVLGLPSNSAFEKATRTKLFFDKDSSPKVIPNSRGKIRYPGTKNLDQILKGADKSFIRLVKHCFAWDPDQRISASEALEHEWIQEAYTKAGLKHNSSRGGSAQPHQGHTPRHSHKSSLEESSMNPSFQTSLTNRKHRLQNSFLLPG